MAHSVASPTAPLDRAPLSPSVPTNVTSEQHFSVPSDDSPFNLTSTNDSGFSLSSFMIDTVSSKLVWMLVSTTSNVNFTNSLSTLSNMDVEATADTESLTNQAHPPYGTSPFEFSGTVSSLNSSTESVTIPDALHSWLTTYLVTSPSDNSMGVDYFTSCLQAMSLVLNLYVYLAIVGGRTQRSRTNSLMQNVFASSFLLAMIGLPFELYLKQLQSDISLSSQHFAYFGKLLCRVVPSLQIITEFVTAVSLTILVVDRSQSICARHNYRITNVFSVELLTKLIWLVGLLLAVPTALYSNMVILGEDSGQYWFGISVCRLDLSPLVSNGRMLTSLVHPTFLVLYMCTLYLVPVSLTLSSQFKTYLQLLQHSHRYSHVRDLQKRIRTSDREAVCMLSFVVALFVVFWLPLHLLQIASQIVGPFREHQRHNQHSALMWSLLYTAARQLPLLATCLNPLAYLCLNRQIREQFIHHVCHSLHLMRPSLKKHPLRNYGPGNNSTTSTSSASSSSSASTPPTLHTDTTCCNSNSLQKLLLKSESKVSANLV